MKTVEVTGKGDNTHLAIGSRDIPTPNLGQVLIEVFASGVNRADILQRQGKYPPTQGVSDILGLEVAGKIVKIGEDVTTFKEGDKVFALLEGGGYAEFAVANVACVLPIPQNMNYVEAASLPEALFTAYSNLFFYAKMQKGESLLMHGGTSGIGVIAIQMAKEFGIKCFATAGSEKKCEFLNSLGVDLAINYKEQDFVEAIKQAGGVDVVLDMVGGDYFQKNLSILKQSGRLISIAMQNGAKTDINFAPLLLKNLTIIGTTLRNKPVDFKASIAKDLISLVLPKIASGRIKPVIDSVFSIDEAQKAHDLMQSGQHIGKIVLKFN
jgi:putative PIG3 family NAD(P)H quinone oxidoreductase